jgi:hypothetical protein
MKRPKPVFNSSTNPLGTSRSQQILVHKIGVLAWTDLDQNMNDQKSVDIVISEKRNLKRLEVYQNGVFRTRFNQGFFRLGRDLLA